ncbi:(d)CMP kinase [Carboxydothermus hydrogenoformans]|uniref:Cytidylate kinase n=1 Tax=Carboxydothermus hydrogenoformans (strain ATCC BAA-161 / DSM 6008 / Z-2901) TaxID=246194 RepID=KCY_CARHZ|nr:(d)CMP kinase [Carboxydothermus hydrogenoformans]Q3AAT8.1 RecName: Full=Cytidylate kinase; Short=CK; AltName: Full=Cytidine monophosphate kinase; Short=CMP kinase [Carboxydothermus hydrogenoformans Z-2901]ABB14507.1 cytidylate kinase [Carboxydothermus hydrogenoformans Z-2901]
MRIAIDGPAGAGKSTVARILAKKLSFTYLDTGAMYRAVTVLFLENNLSLEDENGIKRLLEKTDIKIIPGDEGQKILLNERDVTELIRTPQVSELVAKVSALPEVRKYLTELQRKIIAKGNVVADGRDIGTVVMPEAEVKIFLTASAEERARRRHRELLAKGYEVSYEEVFREVLKRDELDTTREISPLRKAEDAILVDTTGLKIEEVVAKLLEIIGRKNDVL